MEIMWNKKYLYNHLVMEQKELLKNKNGGKPVKNTYTTNQLNLFKDRANELLLTKVPVLTFVEFMNYWKTGDRKSHEKPYFEKRERLLIFSVLAWQNPDNKEYLEALQETIWQICSEPFWCVPAHYLTNDNQPLPLAEYETQIDLFASETGFALAETLELTQHLLDETLVQHVKTQIKRRILTPFMDGTRIYRFETMSNNWSAVCAGAIGSIALHMVEDKTQLVSILDRCLSTLDVYLESFGEDGVCTEGVDYWSYGFGFFICFADLLKTKTHGKLNLFTLAKVEHIARSQQWFYFSGKATVSFADGGDHSNYRVGITHYLNELLEAPIPCSTLAADTLMDHCYRYCLGIRDFLWCKEDGDISQPENIAKWLPDAKWFLKKEKDLAMVIKAGDNNESHNHNDCGSLIVFAGGEQVICDLGAGLYDADYFSEKRYKILVNRSKSHNVPIINHIEQGFGKEYTTTQVWVEPDLTGITMGMEHCYPNSSGVKGLVRNVKCGEDKIILTDRYEFVEKTVFTEVFCGLEPIIIHEGVIHFTRNGQGIEMAFDNHEYDASTISERYMGHDGKEKIAYFCHVKPKKKESNMVFEAIITIAK